MSKGSVDERKHRSRFSHRGTLFIATDIRFALTAFQSDEDAVSCGIAIRRHFSINVIALTLFSIIITIIIIIVVNIIIVDMSSCCVVELIKTAWRAIFCVWYLFLVLWRFNTRIITTRFTRSFTTTSSTNPCWNYCTCTQWALQFPRRQNHDAFLFSCLGWSFWRSRACCRLASRCLCLLCFILCFAHQTLFTKLSNNNIWQNNNLKHFIVVLLTWCCWLQLLICVFYQLSSQLDFGQMLSLPIHDQNYSRV